jgi:hypothetical protein
MCTRCGSAEAPEPFDLCAACAAETRDELAAGLQRLTEYLTAWAAFDEWLRGSRPDSG